MRKLLFLIFCIPFLVQAYDIKQIRQEFYEAVNSEKAANEFYKKIKSENLNDALILAYYGSAEALRAKHAWNPYNKVSFLKNGLKNLEKAVALKPESLEIRFLRFSLEHYLPSFLGLSKNLESDRKQIVKLVDQNKLGTVDRALLRNIVSFMKESKRCTASEAATLEKAISNG